MIVDIQTPQNFVFSPDFPIDNSFAVIITNDSNETRTFTITALVARGDTWVNFCWFSGRSGTFQGGSAWGYFRQSDYQFGRSYMPICIYDLQARNYFNASGEVPKISQLDSSDWKTWNFSQSVDIPPGETILVPFTFTVKWDDIAFLNQIFAVLVEVADGVDIAYKEKYVQGIKCTGKTYITDMRVKNLNVQAGTMDVEFDVQSDCGETSIFNLIMKHPTKGYLGRLYQLVNPKLKIGLNTFTFHYSDADWGIQTIKDTVEMGGGDIIVGVSMGNISTCEQGGVGEVVCKTVTIQAPAAPHPVIFVQDWSISPDPPVGGQEAMIIAIVGNSGGDGSDDIVVYDYTINKELGRQNVFVPGGQTKTVNISFIMPEIAGQTEQHNICVKTALEIYGI